jgi:hypothetical protein
MFLLSPSQSEKRVLLPGKVVESTAESFAITLEAPQQFTVGLETLAFCEIRGKFFQQGATLIEVRDQIQPVTFVFNRNGEPVSAEQRQTFRVSAALSEIYAQVGPLRRCQVADISPEGFAVIASPGFAAGILLPVSFTYENFSIKADARVQTIKVLSTGKVRYGLLVPKANVTARNTLQRLSVALQRTQLRRLSGVAA